MSYHYSFTPTAHKAFSKLPSKLQQRIITKLDYFCRENPLAFTHRIKGTTPHLYRFRISTYRVIFEINSRTLTILDLGHRRDIYR